MAAAKVAEEDKTEINEMLYEGISRDFYWFMNQLISQNDKVRGCELVFPDTVFFKNGKPVLVVKSDLRDFCLMGIRHPKKLSLASLYKDF